MSRIDTLLHGYGGRSATGSNPWVREAILLAVVAFSVSTASGDAEVVLSDGRVLTGTDVRRDGDLYLLEQESGTIVPIPLALVAEIRLLEPELPPEPPPYEVDPTTGITYRREPTTLAGSSVKPQGVDDSGPRQLAGDHVEPPRTSDQLAVFGKPSSFSQGVVNPEWTPGSGWVKPDPEGGGWAPSKWSEGPVDSSWEPKSGFRESSLKGSESTWQKGPMDSSWKPVSGF